MARISEINIENRPRSAIQKIVVDHVAEGHTITAEKRTCCTMLPLSAVEAGLGCTG